MLPLDSPRWSELAHAYGSASDVPKMLRGLKGVPSAVGESEPWFSLWSALAHQGDVYPASFAAVPYVIEALASAPDSADASYFQFPAWVEICRKKNCVDIPADLSNFYFEALARLPGLVAEAAQEDWSHEFLSCALAAIAAAKGHTIVAEAVLELTHEAAEALIREQN